MFLLHELSLEYFYSNTEKKQTFPCYFFSPHRMMTKSFQMPWQRLYLERHNGAAPSDAAEHVGIILEGVNSAS